MFPGWLMPGSRLLCPTLRTIEAPKIWGQTRTDPNFLGCRNWGLSPDFRVSAFCKNYFTKSDSNEACLNQSNSKA